MGQDISCHPEFEGLTHEEVEVCNSCEQSGSECVSYYTFDKNVVTQNGGHVGWEEKQVSRVLLVQAEGFPKVRVFDKPDEVGKKVISEVPSNTEVRITATSSNFCQVQYGSCEGWVGVKHVRLLQTPGPALTPATGIPDAPSASVNSSRLSQVAEPMLQSISTWYTQAKGSLMKSVVEACGRAGLAAEYKGYKLIQKLSGEGNAEKEIWRGRRPDDKECVLCFPKDVKAVGALQREQRILELVGPHEHIIGFYESIVNWGGQPGLLCLVLELVDPLGYDLFEAFYQQAVLAGERSVPLHQVKHYVIQIACALEALHSKNIVHRDLKVDNVLIKGAHQVKLIDFGGALAPGIEARTAFTKYSAPELSKGSGDQCADYFGIGVIIYSLCSGLMPSTANFERASRRGQLANLLEADGVTGEARTAAQHLLHHDPSQRWTIAQVKEWAGGTPLSPTMSNITSPVQRWSNRFGEIPRVFGFNLLGNELDGKSIGELGLASLNMLVLLVIRNGLAKRHEADIIRVPNPFTILRKNDWVCFGVGAHANINRDEQHRRLKEILKIPHDETPIDDAVERCAKDAHFKGLYPFLPEFDLIKLPPHCANAVLGPEKFAAYGQNALNLRDIFGINLAGLRRADGSVTWFPGAGAKQAGLIQPGDYGLTIRVPPPGEGAWEAFMPSITKDQWENLIDEDRFKQKMNLADDAAAWLKWMGNACTSRNSSVDGA